LSLLAGALLTVAGAAQQFPQFPDLNGLQNISQLDLDKLDLGGIVIPIPQINFGGPPQEFVGSPAIPNPFPAKPVPQSPFMAPNGLSGVHLDAYQSDTYPFGGPLGRSLEVTSTFRAGLCGTVTFDSRGRIIVVCVGRRPIVYLMDPVTLRVMSRLPMPADTAADAPATFGAGGYFFLDQLSRAEIPTRSNDLWRVKVVEGFFGPTLVKDHTCEDDLPNAIPSDQSILSTFPDSHGLLWFTTSGNEASNEPAYVGTIVQSSTANTSCTVKVAPLPNNEIIRKSFGVDPDPSRGGVFVVSNKHLYRFDAQADGTPGQTWSAPYNFGIRTKPGQLYQGSGTTPTLMGTDYVAIGDNADPRMHVDVFKRTAAPVLDRLVCSEEVFPPIIGDSFNSLIATDTSISIENNYGYEIATTLFGLTTVPGITRVDLDSGGTGCHTVWENKTLSVPNVVSQASLANGLEYTYTKQGDLGGRTDAWYFTAVDMRTGELVYKQLAGTGVLFDSHYSSVYLGPDGKTAYVGVLGGLVRIHDRR
jgi:hypothetical protein